MKDIGRDEGVEELENTMYFLEIKRQHYMQNDLGGYAEYGFRFKSLINGAEGIWRWSNHYDKNNVPKMDDNNSWWENHWEEARQKAIQDGELHIKFLNLFKETTCPPPPS